MFRRLPAVEFTGVMFAFFAHSKYMPCPGVRHVAGGRGAGTSTSATSERRIDFQMFRLRGQIARFELELAQFLDTPAGRFETWYAENRRAA